MKFFLCSPSCGKHTSTKHMRKIPLKEKITMKKKAKTSVCGPSCYFRSNEGEINRPLTHTWFTSWLLAAPLLVYLKKKGYSIVLNFFLCSRWCGKHTSTKHMRIRKKPLKDKITMKRKAKLSFWGPPCCFRSNEGEINRPLSHTWLTSWPLAAPLLVS